MLAQNVWRRANFFQLIVRKWREEHIFFSNLICSNCSYGQVECNFDNRYKNVLEEGWETFTHCPKLIRISNFFKTIKFSPTCSSAHVKCNFDNSWKSFGSRPKKFVQLPNMIEEVHYFWKFFSKIVPLDRWNENTLTNPMKILKQNAEKLTLIVQKWGRK